jgi:TolB-like protein/Flp pilus assembly protein TadD
MDDSIDTAHSLLGSIYLVKLQFEKAVEEAERAVALNPNGAQGIIALAGILGHAGRWEESVSYAKKSIRLDPVPDIFKIFILGRAQFMTGHYDESIAAWKKALQKNPDYLPAHVFLAACYSSLGRDAEAAAEAKEVLRIDPKFSVESHAKILPYRNKANIEREVNALRKAGLPEKPSASIPLSGEVAPTAKVTPPLPEKVSKPAAPPPAHKEEVASKDKMAYPLPDLPSIAVLPFVNMSEDPKQEFLSDGLTEEITTALSKVPHLFVISRQSSFSYKGKPVKVKQVSEELGVRYVLEGSIQKSAGRIRINAQLIDALTGRHIWAERYERELRDIFAVQDEITINILTAIRVKLTEGQKLSGTEKYFRGKQGLDCYLKMLEARKYLQGHNVEDTRAGGRIVEEMVAMCPESPMVYAFKAYSYWMEYWLGPVQSRRESIEKGMEIAQKALAMDDSIAGAHSFLGMFYSLRREFDKAIAEGERAVALDPGGATAHMFYALSLYYVGRSEEAILLFQKAVRLDPVGTTGLYLNFGHALRVTGRFEEALSAYKKSIQREPKNIFAHTGMAATYILMDREQEARAEAAEVLRINPNFSLDSLARSLPFKEQSMIDSYIGALRKAGLK